MLVLLNGKAAQTGPVRDVLNRPSNLAVAGLLAVETIRPGRILKTADGLVTVAVASALLLSTEPAPEPGTPEVYVCIRAEDVILLKGADGPGSARNRLPATVRSLAPEGPRIRAELDCGFSLTAVVTKQACEEMALKPGDALTALIKAPHIHLIPR